MTYGSLHNNSFQTDLYTTQTFVKFAPLIVFHKSPLRSEAAELRRYVRMSDYPLPHTIDEEQYGNTRCSCRRF